MSVLFVETSGGTLCMGFEEGTVSFDDDCDYCTGSENGMDKRTADLPLSHSQLQLRGILDWFEVFLGIYRYGQRKSQSVASMNENYILCSGLPTQPLF